MDGYRVGMGWRGEAIYLAACSDTSFPPPIKLELLDTVSMNHGLERASFPKIYYIAPRAAAAAR